MYLILAALFRELARHPWQLLLTLFSIAAGVAIVVGVDVANESAMKEFERANRIVDGVATHHIVGGEQGLDQDIYRIVKVDAQIRDATPIVSADVTLAGDPGTYQLLGIVPLTDFRIRRLNLLTIDSDQNNKSFSNAEWPVYVGGDFAQQNNKVVTVTANNRSQPFQVVGQFNTDAGESGSASQLLVTDIAWAQNFLDMQGRLSYIALKLPGNYDLTGLKKMLPDSAQLIDLNLYNSTRQAMTSAFRTNLTALSLLALVIAMFLVYSTMSFQIARRATLFAMLRAAGASGWQIVSALAIEVFLVAVVATLIGVMLGAVLATGLGGLVTDTINALYFKLAESGVRLSGSTLIKGLFIGIGATFAACVVPVSGVVRSSVRGLLLRSRQEQGVSRFSRWSAVLSGALVLIGLACLTLSRHSLVIAFAGLFMVILGLAALAPWIIQRTSSVIGKRQFSGNWLGLKMAVMNIRAHLSRTAVAVAALTVAVSATLGVGLMIDSFRFSVERWMENYLRADIYISSNVDSLSDLSPALLGALGKIDGVHSVSYGTRRSVQGDSGPIILFALNTLEEGFAGFQVIDGGTDNLWSDYHDKGEVLITEPLSRRLGIGAGDKISLHTDHGQKSFAVAAVYTDYSSDRGLVSMDWKTYRQFYDSERVASAALYLDQQADINNIIARVKGLEVTSQSLLVRSNKSLRQASLAVFDQTFRITDVLRWLALIVAVAGIVSALMALQLERAREYAVLKAIGYTRLQLSVQMMLETSLTGLWAGLLSIPMGFFLALALIKVINVRSFGWSMATIVDWSLVSQAVLLGVVAAALAGLYPAWRLWKLDIVSGLRNE